MKNEAYIWLALICILSIICCSISWKSGSWMDRARKDEPVAWIILAIAVVLLFI